MSRAEKLLARLKNRPSDLSWDELSRALASLGYEEVRRGKTGGSRRRFIHPTAPSIFLHKPHPGNIVKLYAVREIASLLEEEGLL